MEAKNTYIYLLNNGQRIIDVSDPQPFERGVDFYVDVFKYIEQSQHLVGFTFYIATVMPPELPSYGDKVILLVVSDEHYLYKPYFLKIACVIRSYGAFPTYRDGFPGNKLRLLAFIQYIYKLFECATSLLDSAVRARTVSYLEARRKVLHVPIALFFRFNPKVIPVRNRETSYAFLGSVAYDPKRRKLFHRIFSPPKLASRALMIAAMNKFRSQTGKSGSIFTTGDLEESILNRDMYINTLQNTKISICPRGSNLETYRFFESMKSGCVVICEPLPKAWFYDGHPGVIIRSWNELPSLLSRLLSDDDLMQKLSDQALEYWNRSASEVAVGNKIALFINSISSADPCE
jgi:hypothetical protein